MTEEPTPEQVSQATIEYREHFFRKSDGTTRLCRCGVTTVGLSEFSEHRMRAALVAAAGAAPQEPKREDMITAISGGTITVPGGYGELQRDDAESIIDALMPTLAAPVQVDEDELAGVLCNALGHTGDRECEKDHDAVRAVLAHLRGGGQ